MVFRFGFLLFLLGFAVMALPEPDTVVPWSEEVVRWSEEDPVHQSVDADHEIDEMMRQFKMNRGLTVLVGQDKMNQLIEEFHKEARAHNVKPTAAMIQQGLHTISHSVQSWESEGGMDLVKTKLEQLDRDPKLIDSELENVILSEQKWTGDQPALVEIADKMRLHAKTKAVFCALFFMTCRMAMHIAFRVALQVGKTIAKQGWKAARLGLKRGMKQAAKAAKNYMKKNWRKWAKTFKKKMTKRAKKEFRKCLQDECKTPGDGWEESDWTGRRLLGGEPTQDKDECESLCFEAAREQMVFGSPGDENPSTQVACTEDETSGNPGRCSTDFIMQPPSEITEVWPFPIVVNDLDAGTIETLKDCLKYCLTQSPGDYDAGACSYSQARKSCICHRPKPFPSFLSELVTNEHTFFPIPGTGDTTEGYNCYPLVTQGSRCWINTPDIVEPRSGRCSPTTIFSPWSTPQLQPINKYVELQPVAHTFDDAQGHKWWSNQLNVEEQQKVCLGWCLEQAEASGCELRTESDMTKCMALFGEMNMPHEKQATLPNYKDDYCWNMDEVQTQLLQHRLKGCPLDYPHPGTAQGRNVCYSDFPHKVWDRDPQEFCPNKCKSCGPGGPSDGGVPLTNGKCAHWCAQTNYCGKKRIYRTGGTDCSRCNLNNSPGPKGYCKIHKTDDPAHGNVCFKKDGYVGNSDWECPDLCTKKATAAPWCVENADNKKPCRTEQCIDCCNDSCTSQDPYIKFVDKTDDPAHGNACFENDGYAGNGDWECPDLCRKTAAAPWCVEIADNKEPCRTKQFPVA